VKLDFEHDEGDIELKLTTGVHGPGEVHVLIWDP
jgi:L-lactate utilization protein LutC